MRLNLRAFVLAGLLSTPLLFTACIKVQTGPPTTEEALDAASVRGKEIRAEWFTRFQSATPEDKVILWRMFVDSTAESYLRYGSTVADEWRKGNEGRRAAIADTEMQSTVDRWILTQRPQLEAYDDIVEYGVDQIKLTNVFGATILDPIQQLRDQYYRVYSAVFFPKGTVQEYLQRQTEVRGELQRYSFDLERALSRR
ncbi:MAG: hypothetical protein AB1644_05815 [Candidatus Zixiibacteriota bacterium]